jgi:hypothetical protein
MKRRTMIVLAALSFAGWWTFEPSSREIQLVREFVDGSLPLGLSRDSVRFQLRAHGASYTDVRSERCVGSASEQVMCEHDSAIRAAFTVGKGLCGWLGREKVYVQLEFDETSSLKSRSYKMGMHWPYDLC